MRCPRCHSTKLRKSASAGARLANVMRLFVTPVRCYWCGYVFYRPTALTDGLRQEPGYSQHRRAA